MSQMLVRIDEEMDEALTRMFNNEGMTSLLSQYSVLSAIVRGIYRQWKPNHEAMLKLREEARRKNEAKS